MNDEELASAYGLSPSQLQELQGLLSVRLHTETVGGQTIHLPGEDDDAPPPAAGGPGDRYTDQGQLGVGGMGEVRRVFDKKLQRTVAMKVLHRALAAKPRAAARFIEEAQTAAMLQHPGILPIYDIGRLPDGVPYFTMKEMRGQTLRAMLRTDASLRRLVEVLHRAAEAVGYAHGLGVVHRDLKPENIMVGAAGEVRVVDWGIARRVGEHDTPGVSARPRDVRTTLAGTPAYMAPEQARGETVTAASDAWALGAMLYELLTGSHPDEGLTARAMLSNRQAGWPAAPVRAQCRWPEAETLCLVADTAMAAQPADRYPNAAAFSAALAGWLDGEARRRRAEALCAQAAVHQQRAEDDRARAQKEHARARVLLEAAPAWAPEEEKLPGWQAEDAAEDARRAAAHNDLEAERLLRLALSLAPNAPDVRLRLAARYRALHAQAEADRDSVLRDRAGAFLGEQIHALPDHPEMRAHQDYLDGTGAVTLYTDPPGAAVALWKCVPHRRRRVAREVRHLGTTPLDAAPLPPGSWLLVITHPDCETVRYPVQIDRQTHWDGVPPGATAPQPVPLPPRGSLGPNERYVPPGWFQAGGDPDAAGALPPSRWWCDGFIMAHTPVTNADILRWLNTLLSEGRPEEAAAGVPTDASGIGHNKNGAPIYHRDRDGRYILGPDPDGDVWEPDWPVVMLNGDQMLAYITWRQRQDGLPWRFPSEMEWEKAARGVDGRFFPWGDTFDPSWCSTAKSHPQSLYGTDDHPIDESPYGIRGLAGNSSDMCLEPSNVELAGPRVTLSPLARHDHQSSRGGAWSNGRNACRAAARGIGTTLRGLYSQGFRLTRSWPEPHPSPDPQSARPQTADADPPTP